MTTKAFAPGSYRYLPALFQYSSGVMADPGFRIERIRFATPVPLAAGFERAAAAIKAAGRPLTAFCACELRSPAPFTDAGFRGFNEHYVQTLQDWGIYRDGDNPVARSNVCPAHEPPPEPSFHAFCFTVPDPDAAPAVVIAGSAEARPGPEPYAQRILRLGDTSRESLADKAAFVADEMARRLGQFDLTWADVTDTQVYSVHDVTLAMGPVLVARGAARHGIEWHFARPPVIGLDFEMDCRATAVERVLRA